MLIIHFSVCLARQELEHQSFFYADLLLAVQMNTLQQKLSGKTTFPQKRLNEQRKNQVDFSHTRSKWVSQVFCNRGFNLY